MPPKEVLKILTPNSLIEKRIKAAINKALYKEDKLHYKFEILTTELNQMLRLKFLNSDTYDSLLYADLKGEFGLTDAEAGKIYDIIVDIVQVEVALVRNPKVNGLITLEIGFIDKADIDYSVHGVFTTEKGDVIPWLEWLLTAGQNEVVPDYNVFLKQGIGRSELGIMIKPIDGTGSYSIDSYFAGTEGDNWITKTLYSSINEIKSTIKRVMES